MMMMMTASNDTTYSNRISKKRVATILQNRKIVATSFLVVPGRIANNITSRRYIRSTTGMLMIVEMNAKMNSHTRNTEREEPQ